MRDKAIKEAFIKYLQHSTDERFFQTLTNFTQMPFIGSANTPDGKGWRDLWHTEGDTAVNWLGKDLSGGHKIVKTKSEEK